MKITPIDERLRNALAHVHGFGQYIAEEIESCNEDALLEQTVFADYPYINGLKESLELVKEYTLCFGADGRVSQRGQIPKAWNPETIFESDSGYTTTLTEEASPEQKDANAKKLLEELT